MTDPTPSLVLVGPPGAGKSTVGRLLAAQLDVELVETDDLVAAESGRDVAELFLDLGEEGFREAERHAVGRALQHDGAVVTLGGGAVSHPEVRAALSGLPVVFLDVSPTAGMPRVGLTAPRAVVIGSPRAAYRSMAAERRPWYAECARWTVDTSSLSPEDVVAQILDLLDSRPQP